MAIFNNQGNGLGLYANQWAYVGFLPQQLIDSVDGAAPREAAVEVCRPWAACLASFGRRKRQVCGFVCGLYLLCVRVFRIGGSSRFFAHVVSFSIWCVHRFNSVVHCGVGLCDVLLGNSR